jgi:hypothetical protein
MRKAEDKIYALPFFHVSVNDEDSPSVIWEYALDEGCLICSILPAA